MIRPLCAHDAIARIRRAGRGVALEPTAGLPAGRGRRGRHGRPALAQVNVGNASMARNLVPADKIEAAGVQQYGQLLEQARAKGALAGDNNPQLQRLRAIANGSFPSPRRGTRVPANGSGRST
jgi:hypothetical protein